MTLTFGSLFSGIGGLDLGLERAGMERRFQIEIDDYCRRVLTKHWPGVQKYGDIREVSGDELERVDLLCGGFPCQDVSRAGLRAGLAGQRSGLWSEYLRLIRVVRPRYVVMENVAALLDDGIGRVLGELAASGYDAEWDCLPAAAFGAPHLRDRVYLVAHTDVQHGQAGVGDLRNRPRSIFADSHIDRDELWVQAVSRITRSDDGLPARIYRSRVEALGNAVVPQVGQFIGERIVAATALETA